MKEKITAILIDIDGCLIPTNGDVSRRYYLGMNQIAQRVKEANRNVFPSIGFCTGRDRNYVEAVSFAFGLPNSWSVIESGIALFNPFTKELIVNPALTTKVEEAFRKISEEKIPRMLEKYPELFPYPGNMINVALERQHGSNISIENAYEAVREEMKDFLKAGMITIHHTDIAIDISPAGIDKASGVQFLAQYTGLDLAKTLGIGDSNGDFPMLNLVGYIGCPANASQECKELIESKGGYKSPLFYTRGVADIIRHFT